MSKLTRGIATGAIGAILWLCTSTAAALPQGAVTLAADQIFSVEGGSCGYVANQWIPGRMLSATVFYSCSAERRNVIKRARRAIGSARARLQRKARSLLSKQRTLAALCASGPSATPTPTPTISLTSINSNLYHTEHALFIIPESGQVDWNSTTSWDSVYSSTNIASYLATLRTQFPGDYFFVVLAAMNLQPDRVPNVLTYRQIASGIGQDALTDPTASNICRYNLGTTIGDGAFAVLDHEIGHNWGVFIGSELGFGHWRSNSTASGLMAEAYTDDGFATIKRISGNPSDGFTWTALDNSASNETDSFSEHDLYLQGLSASFPTLYRLNGPTYQGNGTMSYSSVDTYDQSWVETRNGVRSPSYRTSEKQFKLGFVYIARDLNEIQQSYPYIERSIRHYVYAESVDTTTYRFQVPHLVATRYRGSVIARLADLDGNTTPTLAISGASYTTTTNGAASFTFTASDSDGTTPAVSCVPTSANCVISGNSVQLSGLSAGTHFFTIKAEDSGGKKAFAHLVVDAS